ncbi:MAG: clostripain-related cysteine peptidase [Anaerolineaceae bacterium]
MKTRNKSFLNQVLIFVLLLSLLAACGGETEALSEDAAEPEVMAPAVADPTSPPSEAAAPVASGEAGTWLVMLYQNADDGVLEKDIFIDLNEAEIVGSTDQVKVVSQIDRFKGAFEGDGDWTSTKRYLITQDDDLEAIKSQELEDLGEIDSGNKKALVDFATWAIGAYPADHYVLILSDHGAGWDGGWNDNDPVENSAFKMQDIDDALGEIITQTQIGAFELVGFDACLMGQLEVMSAVAPHARYAVGSEEVEPSLGWAYAKFLQSLNENPAMTGIELGQILVDGYIDQDFRITDDRARGVYSEDLGATGEFSAADLAAYLGKSVTLSAIDLGTIQDLNAAVNELAVALTQVDQGKVAEARAYAQAYTNVFGEKVQPPYIDLGHFVDLLLESVDDPAVKQAGENVQSALKQTVFAEKHGTEKPASSGLTIYFPNSALYQLTFGGTTSLQYSAYIGRFATASVWDDFLTFHYTGATFDPAAADLTVLTPAQSAQTDFTQAVEESAPETGLTVAPPGAGEIKITPLTISATEIPLDGKVSLSTEITGSNISYIYYYVSYYNEDDGSFLTADMGFINAETTKEVGGVYYPDWGDEQVIPIEVDWEPTLYFMSDGDTANDQFAFFEPETYGADEATTTYTVRGIYKFVDDGTEMEAVISFGGDANMQNIYGFNGEGGSGAPREITPQNGDTFTITDEWLEFNQNPDGEFVDYTGGTMTFGNNRFVMSPYSAVPGNYILGIIVEDMDGHSNEEFINLTVTP